MVATVGGLTVPASAGAARLNGDRFGSLLLRAGAEQPVSARVEADTVNVIAGTGRAAHSLAAIALTPADSHERAITVRPGATVIRVNGVARYTVVAAGRPADTGGVGVGVGLDRGSSGLAPPTLTRLTVPAGPDVGPDRATGRGPVRGGVDLVARG
ncbi:hypothetical protein [Frankia sp. AgKG'84/4]|uniref:hypothetical protein n=1 Tax=Frankia sp. AgKG'84/4 TaxID=573490 RepID=UPI00200FEE3B|nr:hypothetical protein [Frankia sp. AgKG'84/4]MCL9794659.1 hypothetical protein [Frankia sp. AgKG'84/4]